MRSVAPADPARPEAALSASESADDPVVIPETRGREPHAVLLVLFFTVISVLMTFPNLNRFGTHVGGDSGDALLNIWIMRAVQTGLPHGWSALWSPGIFRPATNTLAYSDTLLSVALVHWPLRTLFGDVVATNIIAVGSWVLASWCVYRLTRRWVRYWGTAVVAALAYTYAPIRLSHHSHFQLVVGGALLPLVVLLMLRLLERPSVGRGIALGVAFAALTFAASYFGAMMGVVLVIVAGGWLLTLRRGERKPTFVALGATLGVLVVLVAPVGLQYLKLQQHKEFRRGFEPASAAHLKDFLSAGAHNYLLQHLPIIGPRSTPGAGGIENRLFPGFVALGFGIAGIVLIVREIRKRGLRSGRTREVSLLTVAGAVCLVLSFGDWFRFRGHRIPLPFFLFRHGVPGFAGIRAVSRFATMSELALVCLAAIGLDALLLRLKKGRFLAAAALVLVVCAETAMALSFVHVPTSSDDGGVDTALRARPAGLVAELPMASAARGVVWPYVETPRQLRAIADGDPRINGYSGFQPKDFDAETSAVNQFPAEPAIAKLRQLGVRYVVLRTKLVGPVMPGVLVDRSAPYLGHDGVGVYSDATAQAILHRMPSGLTKDVVPLDGGYLIDLGAGSGAG